MSGAMMFGPLGSMVEVIASAGVPVESARGRSEMVTTGGVRYVQRGRTAPRSWQVSRNWQSPDWYRLLGMEAHGLLPQCWFYDSATARENMVPAALSAGTWTQERRNQATNPRFRTTTAAANLPTPLDIRAGSFNMRLASMSEDAPERTWDARKTVFAQTVIDSSVAITGLNEVSWVTDPVKSQAESACQAMNTILGAPGRWAWCGSTDGSNAIAYDTTKVTRLTDPVTLPVNINFTLGETRTMVWARFRHLASGVEFIMAVTHWQHDSPDAQNGVIRRGESAQIVADALDRLRAEYGVETILSGDFNDTSEASGSPRAALAARGYRSIRQIITSPTNGALNSYNGWDATMAGKQSGLWMDGIYVSTGITVPAAGLMAKFASGTALPLATPLPSDHQMIWAGVQVLTAMSVMRQGGGGAVTTGGSASAYQSYIGGDTALTLDMKGGTATSTSVYVAGPVDGAAARLGLRVGHTYTVSVDCIIPAAFGESPSTWARRIVITAGTGTLIGLSPAAAVTPGRTRLAVTFTVPAEASDNATIRLYGGYSSGIIHWQKLLIEESPIVSTYGDGDMPGWSWEGVRDASSSIGAITPTDVPVAGAVLAAVQTGHTVTVPVLAGRTFTISAWTTHTGTTLSYTLADRPPAYISGNGINAHATIRPTADATLTVQVTAPTNTTAGLRIHEGEWDETFYATSGTPVRVAVQDADRTLQMVTPDGATISDYQVTLQEVGRPGTL